MLIDQYRNQILVGNNLLELAKLPEKNIHCVICSPPYWGLRNYGSDPQIWPPAANNCEHEFEKSNVNYDLRYRAGENTVMRNNKKFGNENNNYGTSFCIHCGAWKGELGLEPTPELYIEHLVLIFREVWRILRDDGTLWVNLGDSYWSAGNNSHEYLKPKDLVGIPWDAAKALQRDGWYLRRDIVWSKGNPMPESTPDRPTTSHEYIFLLSKKRKYYYDSIAVREEIKSNDSDIRKMIESKDRIGGKTLSADDENYKANKNTEIGKKRSVGGPFLGRNRRSVWEVNTTPYKDAHFATFPPKLIEPCVLAGTSEYGVCSDCGSPYERILEKTKIELSVEDKVKEENYYQRRRSDNQQVPEDPKKQQEYINHIHDHGAIPKIKTIGWKKTCNCETKNVQPAIVLDPFFGSGTTGYVANNYGRDFVGIEINPKYITLAEKRVNKAAYNYSFDFEGEKEAI